MGETDDAKALRSSNWMGGITERWEYAAAVDRYKETGTVEAHEAMLAAYARLNAAVSEEMPPIDRTHAQNPAKPRSQSEL